jgi:predicted permease
MNFLQLLQTVAPVFTIIAAGVFLRLAGWMKPEADSSLLNIGVNLLYPALIADTILGNSLLSRAGDLWLPPTLAFSVIALSMGLVLLLLLPLRLPSDTLRAGVVCAGMQNYGYLVIPLVESLYDRDTLGVLFLHNLGVELAMWSLAVSVLSHGKGGSFWKNLLNVPVLSIAASGLLNLVHAQSWLPLFLRKSLHVLGQAAIPLALLLTGATLIDLARQRSSGPTPIAALGLSLVARLALLPLLMLALARWLPMPQALQRILILQAAMPAAMLPAVLCRHYQSDSRFSLQIILATTAIGLVTIPLWLRFGLHWIPQAP